MLLFKFTYCQLIKCTFADIAGDTDLASFFASAIAFLQLRQQPDCCVVMRQLRLKFSKFEHCVGNNWFMRIRSDHLVICMNGLVSSAKFAQEPRLFVSKRSQQWRFQ